jgi:hypothetical protein
MQYLVFDLVTPMHMQVDMMHNLRTPLASLNFATSLLFDEARAKRKRRRRRMKELEAETQKIESEIDSEIDDEQKDEDDDNGDSRAAARRSAKQRYSQSPDERKKLIARELRELERQRDEELVLEDLQVSLGQLKVV